METGSLYRDIASRTGGDIYIGVVGPVRTGKSTFIKKFMELMILPGLQNQAMKARTRDELPQSAAGRTIMTTEPKFIPEEAVTIRLGEETDLSVRLIDCVGYMVKGASGQFEDGVERMVTTPWFDHEISLTEAAEQGTYKVIAEHSTIGLVVTCDGTICEIPREDYVPAEERVIRELQEIGKPFTIVLNSADPRSESARALCASIREKYGTGCVCVNCLELSENDISEILKSALCEFPLSELDVYLPSWVDALPMEHPLTTQPMLELVFSVLFPAVGSAILFNIQGSTGGTDIVAMIFKKFTSLDIGKALFCTDFIIATLAGVVFGIETGLFSLLGLLAKALVVDSVIESINMSKYFTIVTHNPDEVIAYIKKELNRSATLVTGEGAYTHEGRKLILTVLNRAQAVRLRGYIRSIDPHAFIVITNTSQIIGKGFRQTL